MCRVLDCRAVASTPKLERASSERAEANWELLDPIRSFSLGSTRPMDPHRSVGNSKSGFGATVNSVARVMRKTKIQGVRSKENKNDPVAREWLARP